MVMLKAGSPARSSPRTYGLGSPEVAGQLRGFTTTQFTYSLIVFKAIQLGRELDGSVVIFFYYQIAELDWPLLLATQWRAAPGIVVTLNFDNLNLGWQLCCCRVQDDEGKGGMHRTRCKPRRIFGVMLQELEALLAIFIQNSAACGMESEHSLS